MDDFMNWANLLYVIIGIIITVIPFAIALAKAIKIAVKDKTLGKIIIDAVKEAELTGGSGADKLRFALDVIEKAAAKLGVKFDKEQIIKQIEELIKLTKTVNVKIKG